MLCEYKERNDDHASDLVYLYGWLVHTIHWALHPRQRKPQDIFTWPILKKHNHKIVWALELYSSPMTIILDKNLQFLLFDTFINPWVTGRQLRENPRRHPLKATCPKATTMEICSKLAKGIFYIWFVLMLHLNCS